MLDNKHTKWNKHKHHPRERCEGTLVNGQCINLKVIGADFCSTHGANTQLQSRNGSIARNYRLKRWQERVGQMADNSNVKSLREEVGILRVILEEMMNKCESSLDLLLYSQRMSDLVIGLKIEWVFYLVKIQYCSLQLLMLKLSTLTSLTLILLKKLVRRW
ncbi:hypothetical protein LCGC14_1281150 [marine sediment metagenome]|uniref:Uncharacterized protein n=1 Tax=marine sediment metagenome TaxID=412755 RepID=A0A0F9NBS8_9ZZZZ